MESYGARDRSEATGYHHHHANYLNIWRKFVQFAQTAATTTTTVANEIGDVEAIANVSICLGRPKQK